MATPERSASPSLALQSPLPLPPPPPKIRPDALDAAGKVDDKVQAATAEVLADAGDQHKSQRKNKRHQAQQLKVDQADKEKEPEQVHKKKDEKADEKHDSAEAGKEKEKAIDLKAPKTASDKADDESEGSPDDSRTSVSSSTSAKETLEGDKKKKGHSCWSSAACKAATLAATAGVAASGLTAWYLNKYPL